MKRGFPLNLPLMVVVLSWGYNFISLKTIYPEMPPYAVMFNRAVVMGILLALLCWIRKLPLKYPGGVDTWRILGSGFISMGVYMVLFLRGLEMTAPAEAAIMLATAPVFTFLLSCLAKQEPFSISALLGGIVGFAGVATVILGGAHTGLESSVQGNIIVLASSALWAVGVVVMRPALHRHDATQLFTLSIPGALPVLLLFGLVPALNTNYAEVSPLAWLNFGQVVLVSGILAFICFYKGIHQIGPSRATMYQFFIPPTAAAFQWLLFGETLNAVQWVGLAVLLSGVLYSSRARARAETRLRAAPQPAER